MDAHSYTTPQDFFDRHIHIFGPISRKPYLPDLTDGEKAITADNVELISHHFDQVSANQWTESGINGAISKIISDLYGAESLDFKSEADLAELKKANTSLSRYLRWAITGGRPGPQLSAIAEIMGRDIVMVRLREAEWEYKNSENHQLSSNDVPRAVSNGFG